MKFLLFEHFGESDIGVLARIIASGIVGWGLLSVIVGAFSTVEGRSAEGVDGAA
ncbi:MAG TPA: hypothetical protein VGP93_15505 [Polyangiaceae bacterium]|nr:hypothetical protein [Polyangiaceae bacterium]